MTVGLGTVIDVTGEPMRVIELLGAGGEGEVFELLGQQSGRRLALKWYHSNMTTPERRAALRELVTRGAPSDSYLWPHGVIEDPQTGRFGYVMDLRPDGFVGLAALLRGQIPRDEVSLARFAFELSMAFRELHLRGLCYRDVNFGNAFMHAKTGAALVCDNDNVCVEGIGHAHVLGSKKFMAPEIVRGEALPSKFTDRYSLAVMLFYLLVVHHPLEGTLTEIGIADVAADLRHFGVEPIFCFDPSNDQNRPEPQWHAHVGGMWSNLPEAVRKLFVRSFTVGLQDPRKRVVDSEWSSALADLRSGLHFCETCQGSLMLGSGESTCGRCGEPHPEVLQLQIGARNVAAIAGAQLTEHHARGNLRFDSVLATIEEHPTNKDRMGLRNDTNSSFLYRSPDGVVHDVSPGRRCEIVPGARVELTDPTQVSVTIELSSPQRAHASEAAQD